MGEQFWHFVNNEWFYETTNTYELWDSLSEEEVRDDDLDLNRELFYLLFYLLSKFGYDS